MTPWKDLMYSPERQADKKLRRTSSSKSVGLFTDFSFEISKNKIVISWLGIVCSQKDLAVVSFSRNQTRYARYLRPFDYPFNEEMRVWKLFGFHKKLLPLQLWITFSSGPLEDISQCIFQALFLTTVLLWKIEFICSGIKCSPSWSSDKGNFCPLNILIRCFYTS